MRTEGNVPNDDTPFIFRLWIKVKHVATQTINRPRVKHLLSKGKI